MFKIAAAASTLVAFAAILVTMPSSDASGGRPVSAQDFAAAQAALLDGNPCAEKAWPYYEQNCLRVVKPDTRPKPAPAPVAEAPTTQPAQTDAAAAAVSLPAQETIALVSPQPASVDDVLPPITRPETPQPVQATRKRPAEPTISPVHSPRPRMTKSASMSRKANETITSATRVTPQERYAPVERYARVMPQERYAPVMRHEERGYVRLRGIHQAYAQDAYAYHSNGIAPPGFRGGGLY